MPTHTSYPTGPTIISYVGFFDPHGACRRTHSDCFLPGAGHGTNEQSNNNQQFGGNVKSRSHLHRIHYIQFDPKNRLTDVKSSPGGDARKWQWGWQGEVAKKVSFSAGERVLKLHDLSDMVDQRSCYYHPCMMIK